MNLDETQPTTPTPTTAEIADRNVVDSGVYVAHPSVVDLGVLARDEVFIHSLYVTTESTIVWVDPAAGTVALKPSQGSAAPGSPRDSKARVMRNAGRITVDGTWVFEVLHDDRWRQITVALIEQITVVSFAVEPEA